MTAPRPKPTVQEFLSALSEGATVNGVATGFGDHTVLVRLNGQPEVAPPLGEIPHWQLSWRQFIRPSDIIQPGQQLVAEVTHVGSGKVILSTRATEDPARRAFLRSLTPGQTVTGTVSYVENFGVFVALDGASDDCTGFINVTELSWTPVAKLSDVVQVGQRITARFLGVRTDNWQAALSLCALQEDPWLRYADTHECGETVAGEVTKVVPFGVFVRIADGIEGLLHNSKLATHDVVQVGDQLSVTLADIDRERRRISLSR